MQRVANADAAYKSKVAILQTSLISLALPTTIICKEPSEKADPSPGNWCFTSFLLPQRLHGNNRHEIALFEVYADCHFGRIGFWVRKCSNFGALYAEADNFGTETMPPLPTP